MKSPLSTATAALALSLPAAPVQAVVTLDVSLRELSFSAIDLRPDDGIDAGFEWGVGRADISLSSGGITPLYLGPGETPQQDMQQVPRLFQPTAIELAVRDARASASSGEDFLQASLRSERLVRIYSGAHMDTGDDRYGVSPSTALRVAPYTRLTATAQAHISMHTLVDECADVTGMQPGCESGSGSASLFLEGPRDESGHRDSDRSETQLWFGGQGPGAGPRDAEHHAALRATLSNPTALPVYFNFSASVGSSVEVSVPGIPEPHAELLMLGGLGLTALVARARRKAAAPTGPLLAERRP